MCEPISISTGAAWMLGLSAAATVGVAAYSANQQSKAGKANAAMMENNAEMERQAARSAQAMGDRESEQAAWRTRAVMGQQRAAMAANGIDSQIGTPAELLGETAMFGEVDQQTIRLNTAQNAWGFNARALNSRNQAAQARWGGKSQATGTILGGLASATSQVGGFYG